MNIFNSLEEAGESGKVSHLAIGFFDGVHRGHRHVFEAVRQSREGFSILTFWPHPQSILAPDKAPRLITGLEHKLRLFESSGAVSSILVPFNHEFSEIPAEDFLGLITRNFPGLKSISCGPNFHFGKGRLGTAGRLFDWAGSSGIEARIPQMHLDPDGQPVSSSRIRSFLQRGDLKATADSLGRPYGLWGRVIRGRQNGRSIGFPTVNLETTDEHLLAPGVYGGTCAIQNGECWRCAINIGHCPTVSPTAKSPMQVEAHLLGFKGDLYGTQIEIQPKLFIRAEKRFENLDALRKQIETDIDRVPME